MSCPTITTIQPTECIGNSLNTINNNYQALRTGVCDNQDQINALRTLLFNLSAKPPTPGSVVQVVHIATTQQQTIDGTMPFNSVPTISNGGEITALSATITPKSASNKILVNVSVTGGQASYVITLPAAIALFRDPNPTAVATAAFAYNAWGGYAATHQLNINYLDTPSTESPLIYRVRAGANSGGFYVNGWVDGSQLLGGSLQSTITLTEIAG